MSKKYAFSLSLPLSLFFSPCSLPFPCYHIYILSTAPLINLGVRSLNWLISDEHHLNTQPLLLTIMLSHVVFLLTWPAVFGMPFKPTTTTIRHVLDIFTVPKIYRQHEPPPLNWRDTSYVDASWANGMPLCDSFCFTKWQSVCLFVYVIYCLFIVYVDISMLIMCFFLYICSVCIWSIWWTQKSTDLPPHGIRYICCWIFIRDDKLWRA